MANTSMASTTRRLSGDDAAFLLDVLHHLEAPITVNIRQIALFRNATPNAIGQRFFKLRHEFGINIQGNSRGHRKDPKTNKNHNVETSPVSNLPESDEILRQAIANPSTPEGAIGPVMSVGADGSLRKRRRGMETRSPRRGKKANQSPASSKQSELMSVEDGCLLDGGGIGFMNK